MNRQQATILFQAAQAWPRCGQSWPCGEVEEEAAGLLVGLDECGRTPQEEAALESALAAARAAKNAAAVERQQTRAALLAASAPDEKSSKTIAAFAAKVPQLTREEAISVGFDQFDILCAERSRVVFTNRFGHILAR